MKIDMDIIGILNQETNEDLLRDLKKEAPECVELLEFANRHGAYGFDAVLFILDLGATLDKISHMTKENNNDRN